MIHMCPAIGLQVEAHYLNNTYFFDLRGEQVNFGADQVRNREGLLARQGIDTDGVVGLHRFINFLFDIGDALLVQIFHGKVHSGPVRVHLPSSYLYAKFFKNGTTKDVQCSMRAHHAVTELPINGADDFGSYRRREAIERMPDHLFAFIHGNHGAFVLAVIPGDDAVVGHLAPTAGEKNGRVERYFIAFDVNDCCAAFIYITVFVVGTRGTPVVPPWLAVHGFYTQAHSFMFQ